MTLIIKEEDQMTNAERLKKIRDARGEININQPEERMEELVQIIAEELCKTNEILQKEFNIHHIGGG